MKDIEEIRNDYASRALQGLMSNPEIFEVLKRGTAGYDALASMVDQVTDHLMLKAYPRIMKRLKEGEEVE